MHPPQNTASTLSIIRPVQKVLVDLPDILPPRHKLDTRRNNLHNRLNLRLCPWRINQNILRRDIRPRTKRKECHRRCTGESMTLAPASLNNLDT